MIMISLSRILISPQDISNGMLRRPPINLNKQAQDATILLIREVIERGITLSEVCIIVMIPFITKIQLVSRSTLMHLATQQLMNLIYLLFSLLYDSR